MIVLVKDKNSNREPFPMKKESAERLVKSNAQFAIVGETEVHPIKKKEVLNTTETAVLVAAEGEEKTKTKRTRRKKTE